MEKNETCESVVYSLEDSENAALLSSSNQDTWQSDDKDLLDETFVKVTIPANEEFSDDLNFPVHDFFEKEFHNLPPDKKYHLFMSHSSNDYTEAKRLCLELEQRFHLKCMQFDRDFHPGKLIEKSIDDEMQKSMKIVLLLSPSYVSSGWCMIEAFMAVHLSFKEVHTLKLIPVIIQPVNELPSSLKCFRCIDAAKEEDVATKIMDAFWHTEAVYSAHQDYAIYTQEEIKTFNGSRQLTLYAEQKETLACKKLAYYQFIELKENEKAILESLDLHCEEQLKEAINYVNESPYLKYHRVLQPGRFRILAAFLVALVGFNGFLGAYYLFILMTRKEQNVEGLAVIGGFMTGVLFFFVALYTFFTLQKKLMNITRRKLWLVNKKHYEESKCLVVFDLYPPGTPFISVIRYDTADCLGYLCTLMKTKHLAYSEEKTKEKSKQLMESKLESLQENGLLCNWFGLDSYDYNRHRTWMKKKCLCQMLEQSLLSTKEVIDV